MNRDAGSATLWVLALATLVGLAAVVAVRLTEAVDLRHQAQSAADLTAIGAAQAIGHASDPCIAARVEARRSAAVLTGCVVTLAPDGRSGDVHIAVTARRGSLHAIARAHAARLVSAAMSTVRAPARVSARAALRTPLRCAHLRCAHLRCAHLRCSADGRTAAPCATVAHPLHHHPYQLVAA